MELLMQDWSFSAKLRLPAISRLQKIHNVDVALQVLKDKGVDLKDDQGNYCQHKLSSTKKKLFLFFFLPFYFSVSCEKLREPCVHVHLSSVDYSIFSILQANN